MPRRRSASICRLVGWQERLEVQLTHHVALGALDEPAAKLPHPSPGSGQ